MRLVNLCTPHGTHITCAGSCGSTRTLLISHSWRPQPHTLSARSLDRSIQVGRTWNTRHLQHTSRVAHAATRCQTDRRGRRLCSHSVLTHGAREAPMAPVDEPHPHCHADHIRSLRLATSVPHNAHTHAHAHARTQTPAHACTQPHTDSHNRMKMIMGTDANARIGV